MEKSERNRQKILLIHDQIRKYTNHSNNLLKTERTDQNQEKIKPNQIIVKYSFVKIIPKMGPMSNAKHIFFKIKKKVKIIAKLPFDGILESRVFDWTSKNKLKSKS